MGDTAAVESLLAGGVEVDSRDGSGCTALHFAADRGSSEVARLLLLRGADINAQDEDGQTPLHYAALCKQVQVSLAWVHKHVTQLTLLSLIHRGRLLCWHWWPH